MIPVVMKDGSEELVPRDELQRLINAQQVMFFRRREGWVVLGRDRVRGNGGHFQGKNRRQGCMVSVEMFRY